MAGQEKQNAGGSGETGVFKAGSTSAIVFTSAATGGACGAAAAVSQTARRWETLTVTVLLIPVILLTMLPTVIFGPLMSDGSDTPSGFTDDLALVDRMAYLNAAISSVLSEGLTDVLNRIEQDFTSSGCDTHEVNNPYGANIVFNANAIMSQYCAFKATDAVGISQSELIDILRENKQKLYSFTHRDKTSTKTDAVKPKTGNQQAGTDTETVRTRVYTVVYNGESYFAEHVFNLREEQKVLSVQYAQNLTILLGDGIYQGLPDADITQGSVSYDGVIFTDGSTDVTYYNQLDERWKDMPYGTDNIGGYACGPTAMAIVVSSLTSDTVDPPHMAQWAYEHGYWCSGNGSYHSLIPGAATEWGLSVEGCTAKEPQRIVDALGSGKLVVAIMGKGHFTKSGHFIVLRGVTSEEKVLVADPSSYSRSQKEWDMSIILSEVGKRAGAGGPFWIIGN